MGTEAATARTVETASPWWDRRWFLALVVLATMVPLLYPQIPPLVDLPGHMGRYRVELDLGHSTLLQRYYGFHWAPIGNLGIDLLLLPLAPILGLEAAVKLIVLLIPPLTAIGMLWVAREVHGRVPPTAFLALPFIYSFPFLFGFANFALSAALAFLAFGLWLRLGRMERIRLRGWLFAPIALIVFFCHTYGWGLLGLLCISAELIRLRTLGRSWIRAGLEAAFHCSVMAAPLATLFLWPFGSEGGKAVGWFDWDAKWTGVLGTLRDRWGPFDVTSLEIAGLFFLFALVSPKLTLSRKLSTAAAAFTLCFLLLPRYIFDSAYADVRLLPFLFAVALLAIRTRKNAPLERMLAIFALAFFAVRLGGTTYSFAAAANDQQAKLGALEVMPRGARVVSFFGLSYPEPWSLHRNSHLVGMVIVRREGFANDQWITESHNNLLEIRYREAGKFVANPSQVVRPNGTNNSSYLTIDEALAQVPKDKFDFVWLIDAPQHDPKLVADMVPVWTGPGTILYRTSSMQPVR